MTLDNAIAHCEEVAERCATTDGNLKCEMEHRQLAEWLKELRMRRNGRRGKWYIRKFGEDAKCSECGMYFTDAYDMENYDRYCRHCGAMMEGIGVEKEGEQGGENSR